MSTSTLASASSASIDAGSFFGRIFARIRLEISAFFNELHAAQVRTNTQEPFGL